MNEKERLADLVREEARRTATIESEIQIKHK
jgi:hypothetical protein